MPKVKCELCDDEMIPEVMAVHVALRHAAPVSTAVPAKARKTKGRMK